MIRLPKRVTQDGTVLEAWREQVTAATETPWLAQELVRRGDALLPQFTSWYTYLRRLPRRTRRALQRQAALSLGGMALLFALGQAPAQAALLEVDGATCNLVNAITAANTDTATNGCPAGSGPDILRLEPPGRTITLTQADHTGDRGSSGLPVITSHITITGPGTIERAENAPEFRIFEVDALGVLALENMTVRNGVDTAQEGIRGGGIVANACESLTLTDSIITGNTGSGVATYDCPITISNSTLSENTGFGVESRLSQNNYDDPLFISLDISNSTIHHNQSGGVNSNITSTRVEATTISGNTGIGLSVGFGYGLTVVDSTISGNTGGGIYDLGSEGTEVINSTISGNTSTYSGGGISARGNTLFVVNSTISGNTSEGYGGGIAFSNQYLLDIANTTITGNHAVNGGGVAVAPFIGFSLSHSIVSGNTAIDTGAEILYIPSEFEDEFIDDFNIIGSNNQSGVVGFTPGPTDIIPAVGVDVSDILDPNLTDSGGPTQTHALMPGSLAIDAGDVACTGGIMQSLLTTDQRGALRPADGNDDGLAACDMRLRSATSDPASTLVRLRRSFGDDRHRGPRCPHWHARQ